MQVRRRHVIFLQGYDPRGRAAYYRMFRSELRKFGQLYDLSPRITKPRPSPDELSASWSIETEGPGWQTNTTYEFLRWEDLVQRDRQTPIWRTIAEAIAIYAWLIVSGVLMRFARAHWRFAVFISYPYLVLLAEMLIAAALGYGVHLAALALGLPATVGLAVAAVAFAAALGAMIVKSEPRSFMLYLMADTIFTYRFAHRQRTDWDERIEHFARHLVAVARSSDADELVVVGHSSGSFLGTEIMARALTLDPALGKHGPRIVLFTVGGNLPIIGFLPVSQAFRDNLRRLAVEPTVDWIDCQSRKDVMNFFPFDPIAGHGIELGDARRNPLITTIRLRDMIDPARYNLFRWQFFRVHFQFVMANDRPNAYDFFMIVCGPVSLKDRITRPKQALSIATGNTDSREQAWREIRASEAAAD